MHDPDDGGWSLLKLTASRLLLLISFLLLVLWLETGCAAKNCRIPKPVSPYTIELNGVHFSKDANGKTITTCKVIARGVNAATGAAVWYCQQ